MNEELVFRIRAVAEGFEQSAKTTASSLQQTGQAFTNAQAKAQTSGKAIGSALNNAAEQIRASAEKMQKPVQNMSFDRLYNEFFKLDSKIEAQKTVLKEAEQALEEYGAQWDRLAARGGILSSADSDEQLAQLARGANEAKASLAGLQQQQEQVANAMIDKSASNELKQQTAQTKTGIDAVAFALSSVSAMSGGTIGQIAALAQQVRYLKQGFTATAQTAGKFTAAITTGIAGISIAATVITSIVSSIQQAKDEARQAASEAAQAYQVVSGELSSAQRYIDVLGDQTASLSETREAKQQLADLFPDMVKGYDDEGNAIVATREEMQAYLDVQKELADLKAGEAAAGLETLAESWAEGAEKAWKYEEAVQAIKEVEGSVFADSITSRIMGAVKGNPLTDLEIGWEDEFKQDAARMKRESFEALQEVKDAFLANVDQIFGQDVAAEMSGPIQQMWSSLVEEIEKGGKTGEDAANVITDKIDMLKNVSAKIEDAQAAGQQIGTEFTTALIQGALAAPEGQELNVVDKMLKIDAATVLSNNSDQIQQLKSDLVAAIASEEGMDAEGGANLAQSLLNMVMGDETMQAAYERAAELKQRIVDGLATPAQEAEYDSLISTLNDGFVAAQIKIAQTMGTTSKAAKDTGAAVGKVAKETLTYSDSVKAAAIAEKAASMEMKDAASEMRSLASTAESLTDAFREVADMKGAVQAIKDYDNATSRSAEMTSANAAAKEYLAEMYGIEKDAVASTLPAIEDDIAIKEGLAIADYAVAIQSALTAQAVVTSMVAQGKITADQGAKMELALQKVIDKMAQLASSEVSLTDTDGNVTYIKPNLTGAYSGGGSSSRSSGGSASSQKNTALENELKLMEHLKALNQLTYSEEIAWLERVKATHAKTQDEIWDLEEKIYDARTEQMRAEYDYNLALDRLTLREQKAKLDEMIAQQAAGSQARSELEKELYEVQRELQRQEYDLKVYYGKLTLQQQEQYLKSLIASYKKGTQARIDLEKELYDVQQQLRDKNIAQLDRLAEGITTALANRYAEQQRVEEERIQTSIDNWQTWGEEQVAAIQGQIDALDDLTEEEDRAEEERKKRRKIAALEQQLQYEQDEYNRRKLQEQLATAQDELNTWLARNEREDLKEALQEQIDAVNAKVEAEQDALQEQIDANNAYYEELTKEQNLQAEAQKLLLQSNQKEILNLIKNFAPEYNATGESLGEQLVDGFSKKVGDIDKWFSQLTSKITKAQDQMAAVATKAADQFYSTHGVVKTTETAAATGKVTTTPAPTIIMNFNSDVTSPTEIRREVERLADLLADL